MREKLAELPSLSSASSPEGLRAELAAARRGLHAETLNAQWAEADRAGLVDCIVRLEAEKRALQQEASEWRARYLELERVRAALAAQECEAQDSLLHAHVSSRHVAARDIASRIAATEARNGELRARADAVGALGRAGRLEEQWTLALAESESHKQELEEARRLGEISRAEVKRLEQGNLALQADAQLLKESQLESDGLIARLELRAQTAEARLLEVQQREATLVRVAAEEQARMDCLEDVNHRLRLDLQEAISQAVRTCETPFYSDTNRPAIASQAPSVPIFAAAAGVLDEWRYPALAPRSAKAALNSPRVLAAPRAPAGRSPLVSAPRALLSGACQTSAAGDGGAMSPFGVAGKGDVFGASSLRTRQLLERYSRLSRTPATTNGLD